MSELVNGQVRHWGRMWDVIEVHHQFRPWPNQDVPVTVLLLARKGRIRREVWSGNWPDELFARRALGDSE